MYFETISLKWICYLKRSVDTNEICFLFLDSFPLKMGLIYYPETSGRNYHYFLRNNPYKCSSRSNMYFHWAVV